MEIPEDEREPVVTKLTPASKSNIEYSLRALVGKIISHKVYNKKAIRNIMFKTWEQYKGLKITDMGENKFLFTFPSVSNTEEVLSRGPWFVMNQIISLKRWDEGIRFDDIDFDRVPFWIQIHGLAKKEMNPENTTILLGKVGEILEVDDPLKTGSAAAIYLRARVMVNVTKPIWSGCWLQRSEQEKVWIFFKYERLQGLCYSCGVFGHESKHCSMPRVMAAYDKSTPKFGPFLNASKPRVFHRFPYGEAFSEGSQPQPACTPEHNPGEGSSHDSNAEGEETLNTMRNVNQMQRYDEQQTRNEELQSIPTPNSSRVTSRFVGVEINLPPSSTPPYFVEFPPEEDPNDELKEKSVPAQVEEALSYKLAEGMQLKRGRESHMLKISSGEDQSHQQAGAKRTKIIVVIDGTMFMDGTVMAEEAGIPMPPMDK